MMPLFFLFLLRVGLGWVGYIGLHFFYFFGWTFYDARLDLNALWFLFCV
jgi:hypothetical protein